jgi:2,3-bisphosphoglycerate-independent phosphoglycerate mutase
MSWGFYHRGGVHAHQDHFLAVITGLVAAGVPVAVHGFTDGRDTLPQAAKQDLPDFVAALPKGAFIASLIGRYFAMDRDNRWSAHKPPMTPLQARAHRSLPLTR